MKKPTQEFLKPDFSHLVVSIASAALLKMGLDPRSKEEKDRKMARYNIDLLSVLKEKTKNNLTKEESELLNSCVRDLQLKFVQTEGGPAPEDSPEKRPQSKPPEVSTPSEKRPQDKSSGEEAVAGRNSSEKGGQTAGAGVAFGPGKKHSSEEDKA